MGGSTVIYSLHMLSLRICTCRNSIGVCVHMQSPCTCIVILGSKNVLQCTKKIVLFTLKKS